MPFPASPISPPMSHAPRRRAPPHVDPLPPGARKTCIDLLALMQKRGMIDSIEARDIQRDLRNDTGHVYLATDAEFAHFYNAVAAMAPAVADLNG